MELNREDYLGKLFIICISSRFKVTSSIHMWLNEASGRYMVAMSTMGLLPYT